MIGISIGTRLIGLALIKHGSLVDWRMKVFKGSWSASKHARILNVLDEYMTTNNLSQIALKRPNRARTSEGLDQLTRSIIDLAQRKKIPIRTVSIEELKDYYGSSTTKEDLISYILKKYPEAGRTTQMTKKNFKYHIETIEAVALADLLNQ